MLQAPHMIPLLTPPGYFLVFFHHELSIDVCIANLRQCIMGERTKKLKWHDSCVKIARQTLGRTRIMPHGNEGRCERINIRKPMLHAHWDSSIIDFIIAQGQGGRLLWWFNWKM